MVTKTRTVLAQCNSGSTNLICILTVTKIITFIILYNIYVLPNTNDVFKILQLLFKIIQNRKLTTKL